MRHRPHARPPPRRKTSKNALTSANVHAGTRAVVPCCPDSPGPDTRPAERRWKRSEATDTSPSTTCAAGSRGVDAPAERCGATCETCGVWRGPSQDNLRTTLAAAPCLTPDFIALMAPSARPHPTPPAIGELTMPLTCDPNAWPEAQWLLGWLHSLRERATTGSSLVRTSPPGTATPRKTTTSPSSPAAPAIPRHRRHQRARRLDHRQPFGADQALAARRPGHRRHPTRPTHGGPAARNQAWIDKGPSARTGALVNAARSRSMSIWPRVRPA